MYKIILSRQAMKDLKKLKDNDLSNKARDLANILKIDPFKVPPPYEKLIGDLKGFYSRRINIKHRMVYEIFEKEKTIRILRMWTHYE